MPGRRPDMAGSAQIRRRVLERDNSPRKVRNSTINRRQTQSHDFGKPVHGELQIRHERDLKMVDRIITTADRSLLDNSVMYVAWGTFGLLVLLEKQLIASGWKHFRRRALCDRAHGCSTGPVDP